jgi:magnesium transporter
MIVNCVVYEEGRRLGDIPREEIHRHLGRPGTFVWVALRDPTDDEFREMQAQFGLPELALEDARHGHQRPKIEEYGDSVFVVLQTVEMSGDALTIGELDIFAGRNYVLSIRNHSERGFQDVRTRVEREPELLRHGAGYVLYALMDAVVDRYFPVLDALEAELERIEERIFGGTSTTRANIQALYELKRKLVTMKHATGPLLEATARFFGGRVPPMVAGLGDYFRDVYDHLVRLNQTIDSIRDTVTTALTVTLSMITLQENEVTKRLAAYAALVAVPTMIAGIYGMNFEFMPEIKWRWGYPVTIGVMAALDVWLFWRFRKTGWL